MTSFLVGSLLGVLNIISSSASTSVYKEFVEDVNDVLELALDKLHFGGAKDFRFLKLGTLALIFGFSSVS